MNFRILVLVLALTACADHSTEPQSNNSLNLLAQEASDFAQASPGQSLSFPRDHAAHPDFRLEWWYVTANLEDEHGNIYGAQWTLFRSAQQAPSQRVSPNPWHSPQQYMAHMAISWPQGHQAFQRYARGGDHAGLQRAGTTASPARVWLDDSELRSDTDNLETIWLRAQENEFGMALTLKTAQPLVLHGEQGFSQKHPQGGGSFYYSQPFYQASGTIQIANQEIAVTGNAWLDREWSSQFLKTDQTGWDWFALHLNDSSKLMVFQLRSDQGQPYRYATRIWPTGRQQRYTEDQILLQSVQTWRVVDRELPLKWQLNVPDLPALTIEALHPDQWMDLDFAYWEGVVRVWNASGQEQGRGYMELTGY